MKRAIILHGTDGHPDHNWQPWLRSELGSHGYEVWNPELPDNHTPDQRVYSDFLQKSGWDFSDNIIVGHSSGATIALSLLMSDWLPQIKAVILVGTFLNMKLLMTSDSFDLTQFKHTFPANGFDVEKIKARAKHFYFIHGDQDGYCDPNDAKALCDQLGGKFILIPGAGHFSSPTTSIPEIITALEEGGDLS